MSSPAPRPVRGRIQSLRGGCARYSTDLVRDTGRKEPAAANTATERAAQTHRYALAGTVAGFREHPWLSDTESFSPHSCRYLLNTQTLLLFSLSR